MPQAVDHFLPRVVGIGGADDHLQIRSGLPQAGGGLDAVPAGWHPHIHKRQRVGPPFRKRGGDFFQGLVALRSEIQIEGGLLGSGQRCAEERRILLLEGAAIGVGLEDFTEILVDGAVVIDHQDAVDTIRRRSRCGDVGFHKCVMKPGGGLAGSLRRKIATMRVIFLFLRFATVNRLWMVQPS